jgi:tripartite ATP-independent transporter DctM subunit
MSGAMVGLLGFALMLLLIALRAPVGLAMLLVGAGGYALLASPTAFLAYIKTNSYHQFANYTLSVIPLFILMGALAERAGIAGALFRAAERLFSGVRGGLAMAAIGASAAFGAICGSSVATTATFGRAALPELRRYDYDAGFATGVVAVGGTLGILIPPSIILVVYGVTTEQNIAKLFQAALVPGLMAALFYCITIALVVRRNPALAPKSEPHVETRAPRPLWQKLAAALVMVASLAQWGRGAFDGFDLAAGLGLAALIGLVDVAVMPALVVGVIVVGGIYGGVFTPTEGAAFGVVAMLAVGLAQRTLTRADLLAALRQTAETSAMIFLILFGAEVFGAFLALSRLPMLAAEWIGGQGLPAHLVLAAMLALYLVLGAVMDELAMVLLTLPVFFPVIQGLDFGLPPDEVGIWFGVLVLMVVGVGLTAPPIGLNVFVVHGIARDVPLVATYRGVLPFIAADILRLALVVLMPGLALALVRWLS